MVKRAFYIALVCVIAIGVLLFMEPGWDPWERYKAASVVSKVERFRKAKGRLPRSLSELGVDYGESCPCYCKSGENSYIVWFGTTLGHSETYSSQNRKWSDVGNGVCARSEDQN